MAATLQEIEGRFNTELFRKGDFVIAEIEVSEGFQPVAEQAGHGSPFLSIKGEAELDDLRPRHSYRFFGKFTNYKNKRTGENQKTFEFQTFVPATKHDKQGIVAYLTEVGKGNGVGHSTAMKAWQEWKGDAIRVVRENPRQLLKINPRLTENNLDIIKSRLEALRATEDAVIEVTNLLHGRGFPKATSRKAIKEWGNLASSKIYRDPYALMRFRGCGFKLCDSLWIALGKNPTRLRRQALCAWYAVASDQSGHIWHPIERVVSAVRDAIGPAANPIKAIRLATRLGRLSPNHYGALAIQRTDGVNGPLLDSHCSTARVWVAEGRRAGQESELALMVAEAIRETDVGRLWPDVASIHSITEHQREHLANAMQYPIGIFGGSPGTGKTFTTAQMIKAILKTGVVGPGDIAIGCPTGKAAVRITEAMHEAGLAIKAKTWHSLLGVGEADDNGGEWSFLHNKGNPWPFRVIVGDESSMMDLALMKSVFAARPRGCHMLMVGDVHQLPPVGAGAPLRDMIDSGVVGYGELTEIMRNSGGIVEACAAIRDGKPWHGGDNLIIDQAGSPASQIESIMRHLDNVAERGLNPVWDAQVIVAVNDKSPLARKKINAILQERLNSNPKVDGTIFREGDKVVCLKNGRYTMVDGEPEAVDTGENDQAYVANGEVGRVVDVEEKSILVELQGPLRLVRIPRGKQAESDGDSGESAGNGCAWDLAYGLTCHKLQGSESPVVIVIIDDYPGAMRICDRSWIYTALSRGKSQTIVVGKKSVADAMCRRVAIGFRKTFFRELLQLQFASSVIEDL